MTPDPWHIAVLIPARNEQLLLPRCLLSVMAACAALPPHVTSEIVVASDTSIDDTVPLARTVLGHHILQGTGTVLDASAGNVGATRALAAASALERYRGNAERLWLANTDADCDVPETWLLHQLQHADRGYGAVAGIIDVDCFAEHLPIVEPRFRLTYLIHADGTHPHVHGANLGVRGDAYLHAGGWSPLATAEDHDLWSRLHGGPSPRLSDAGLCVTTSGRRQGRAPMGFARALELHNIPVVEELTA